MEDGGWRRHDKMVEFWQLIFMEAPIEIRMLMAFFVVALIWEIFRSERRRREERKRQERLNRIKFD